VGRTFVGFGFGPIQSGLFVFEAFRSGNFERLVVSEIDVGLVNALKRNRGRYVVNVAHLNDIEPVTVEDVELLNPTEAVDRGRILEAVAAADELATAVPSVNLYGVGGAASIAALLAEGCRVVRPRVIYAAENDNYAAEALRRAIAAEEPAFPFESTAILNTVIGKMSGVVTDPDEITRLGLEPMVPDGDRAIVVEAFNRILVSQITTPGCTRGIDVFDEKPDLLPFEEAKLYGHNAIHALMGYLGAAAGYAAMTQLLDDAAIMGFARRAFLDESGAALCRKYADVDDPLFTPAGYEAYAEDLLVRMTNPRLNDAIARVCRDPQRKLALNDRLYGTMCLALDYGIRPVNIARGAAAGLLFLMQARGESLRTIPGRGAVEASLRDLWREGASSAHAPTLIDLTIEALPDVWNMNTALRS
jgi:mannitol-1-phosphate 5-dehydrogenase